MKQRLTALKAAADAARQTDAYRAEGASIRFTEDLVACMKTCGLTRSALAEKIGASPAYITKILRGDTNFTLDSMVKIAYALGCELTIELRPSATANTAPRRSSVSYRDAPPPASSMLNDQAQD
jgi:transcriptional regulator with XRE-family HTH domain